MYVLLLAFKTNAMPCHTMLQLTPTTKSYQPRDQRRRRGISALFRVYISAIRPFPLTPTAPAYPYPFSCAASEVVLQLALTLLTAGGA
jgi:hypothetical protein